MNLLFKIMRMLSRSALIAAVFVISFSWMLRAVPAQELPATPAAERLTQLLDCLNDTDPESRKPFLTNEFSDEGDLQATLEQRSEISASMHERFAPLAVVQLVESEEQRIVVHCSTSMEVVLRIEVFVSKADHHKITDISMGPVESDEPETVPKGMVRLFEADGKTADETRGIWAAKGYGYVLEITEDSFDFYNVTKSFGWKEEFEDDLFFKKGDRPGEGVFTMHALEPGYNVVRLDELPVQCKRGAPSKPTDVFDAFVEVFREYYPFFKVRNLDWEKRAKQIRLTITDQSSEAELFAAMEAMLKGLGDGHVSLAAEFGGKRNRINSETMNTLKRLRESFKPSDKFKTYSSYFRDWGKRFKSGVIEKTLRGEGKVTGNNQIVWGRPHDRIGYISIYGMGGYAFGNTDAQVNALHNELNEILTKLADTDALILDISFNGGGSDLFSLEIASHFTDERRLGFSKWPATEKQYRQDRFVTPYTDSNAEGTMYLKPIYLVTNDITASAAEIFTMCMRSMPQVTTVGLATEGALSDVLQKTLPNGWELGLSNEIYTDHEGVCHEGPGVPPQIEMNIFNREDVIKIGHAESMQEIVEMMLKSLDSK